jgi:hypothetical protein
MNTYKTELKKGKETETVVIDATSAGQIYGKLCAKQALDGYEVVNCYKGDHRSGSIYYDELVGLTVKFAKREKRAKQQVVEFGFAEECNNLTK